MLIEAYGAQDAIALSDRFSFDDLKSLITQTAEMRKSPEDKEAEHQEEQLDKFIERNQNRAVAIKNPDGTERKLKLNRFKTTPWQ
jgi:hypothetical protein